ncbi:hypothetical protein HJ720_002652 [Salmonella enterica]|nr:hypothetical protein [Salmonella enterica]EGG5584591.1 hypothetical protein [Salmonella enterica]
MFPAPAGINRDQSNGDDPYTSVPRASGDKPFLSDLSVTGEECSPRQRG